MNKYQCYVVETIKVRKLYAVEAENMDEARVKLFLGETVSEDHIQTLGAAERYPDWATVTVNDVDTWQNSYRCPECGHEWELCLDCQCNDDCPDCGCRHIIPYKSEEA